MVDQTKIKTESRTNRPVRAIRSRMAALAREALDLIELQARLFAVDIQDCRRQSLAPVATLAVCGGVLLGCVPVLVLGTAELLIASFDLSRPAALLLCAGVPAAFAVTVACFAWKAMAHGVCSLRRSREEFVRNFQWIKSALNREEPHDS